MNRGLDDLDKNTEISLQDILVSLVEKGDNLALKTEIKSPLNMTRLNIFSKYLDSFEFEESASLIASFIDVFLEYMVSHDRKSRREIIEGIRSLFAKEETKLSFSERITKNMK